MGNLFILDSIGINEVGMTPSVQLQQKLAQKQELKMTQQMRQSIEMLLKSSIELREMMLEEVEQNPFLEIQDWGEDNESVNSKDPSDRESDIVSDLKTGDDERHVSDILNDFDWSQVRESSGNSFGEMNIRKKSGYSDDYSFEEHLPAKESFEEYLDVQISGSDHPQEIREIMIYMVYDLDERGFLTDTDEDIAEITGSDLEDVRTARELIKNFDPPGCGCSDMRDYLRFMFLGSDYVRINDGMRKLLRELLENDEAIEMLVSRKFDELCSVLEVEAQEFQSVLFTLRNNVSPYPSYGYETVRTEYVKPDLKVFLVGSEVIVQIENRLLPTVTLNKAVFDKEIKRARTKKEKKFMREKYRNAEWIIKSISERNRTLYQVAASIFSYQKDFLELGDKFLKPLTLKDVSEDIDRHQATVSRLTNGKYAETPHGIFELKYFFVKQVNDNMTTNRRLEQRISEIIEKENRENPFSDEDIAHILSREGISIARRTVAKYRSKMKIPLARERKRNYRFSVGG